MYVGQRLSSILSGQRWGAGMPAGEMLQINIYTTAIPSKSTFSTAQRNSKFQNIKSPNLATPLISNID